ncbi:hypothetical protein CVT24_006361 [Panaeolus cyanescens]|uniref:AMP-dependent synthetase/ligase domain-containing protein n=1 Tax=Panaeolus cyanescens TaxID=181874 RepID=A0A409YE42_9AGAR|nr:hypothetical protein CVT24_006361 [Panaeolus cyanescens]
MVLKNLRPANFFKEGSVEVAPPARAGESGIRRLAIRKDELVSRPADGVDTIPDIIDYAARVHGNRAALAWRDVVDVHEEKKELKKVVDGKETTETKTWKYFELSDYKSISYLELQEAISEVARAFIHLGINVGDVVDIFAETNPNWQIISHACSLISATTATTYETLGVSGLTHSLNEPKCIAIFTNENLLPTLIDVLPNTPSVQYIFYDGKPGEILDKIRSLRKDKPFKLFHIDELRSVGRELPTSTLKPRRPDRDTLACIMYTSGSTGAPKGVCITHGNMVATVGAVNTVFGPHLPAGDRYIAYLPLAHVLEYMVELCAIFVGITCGYARSKTLTDASVRNCKGDLSAWKPNVMFGVPAVYETIKKGVVQKINHAGLAKKTAFNAALQAKRYAAPWVPGLSTALDMTVFKPIHDAVGGEITFAVNGGAAISEETQDFFNDAVMTLTQGYGLTESCGMCAFLPPELLRSGVVGIPAPSVEIKLLDCPDLGYYSSTESEGQSGSSGNGASTSSKTHLPQGEICIRGPSVTKGYFNRPDLNDDENVFTKDGWFRTGDIGQWNEDGTLSIIDRLKNIVKLQGGEYIALERLESVYKSCSLVANICVHAEPDMSQPIAIIYPHEGNLRKALSSSSDLAPLCKDAKARDLVLRECNAQAKKNGFARMEMLKGVILCSEEWTAENGLVTAAQKLNRGKLSEMFKDDIKKLKD